MTDTLHSPLQARSAGTSHSPSQRSLDEPVLVSADEELDVDLDDAGAGYDTTGSGREASGLPAWWSRTEDQLKRYVSEQPGKAALMALGAGALAAMLLGRGLRGRGRRE